MTKLVLLIILFSPTIGYPLSSGSFIGKHIELFVDKTGTLPANEVLDAEFERSSIDIPQFGYSNAAVWIRGSFDREWIVEVDHSSMDEIEVFRLIDSKKLLHIGSYGDQKNFSARKFFHRNITIKVDSGSSYYIQFRTQSSFKLPLKIWKVEDFYKQSVIEYSIFFIFYGILLAFFVYNLIMGVFTFEEKYFWYSIFICFFTLTHFSVDGLAFQFIWPSSPFLKKDASLYFLGLYCISYVVYCKKFLSDFYQNKLFSILDYIFLSLGVVYLFSVPMFGYSVHLQRGFILLIVISLGMVAKSYSALWKKVSLSHILAISCTIELVAITTYILKSKNIIPLNLFTAHSTKYLYLSQFVLLSIGISESIKQSLKKANFFDGISDSILKTEHEVNRPLSKIKILLSDLETKISLDDEISRKILNIDRDILKVKSIFSGLKSLNMKDISKDEFNIEDSVLEAVRSVSKIRPGVKVPIEYDLKHTKMVLGSERLVSIVIENIFENAIEETKGETQFKIETSSNIRLIQVKIENTRSYIETKMLKEIFKPKISGKPNGFGIGLSICEEIVRHHGGTIEARSNFKRNSVEFVFSLRCSKNISEAVSTLPKFIQASSEGSNEYGDMLAEISKQVATIKILLVEDESIFSEEFSKIIQNIPGKFELAIARNSNEAYSLLKTFNPDIVYLDIDLGIESQNGLEISQRIDGKHIVLLSNRPMDVLPSNCEEFIAKPILKINFVASVHKYISKNGEKETFSKTTQDFRVIFIEDDLEYVRYFCNILSVLNVKVEYEVFDDPDMVIDFLEEGNEADYLVVDRFVNGNDTLRMDVPKLVRGYGFEGKIILYTNGSKPDFKSYGYDYFLSKLDLKADDFGEILK